jgi:peptidyl-tRNA hydrolase
MKMYIALKESLPLGHALNTAAHAGLACYLKFKHLPNTQEWISHSFKKVTCSVTDEEFEALKSIPNHVVLTEDKLDNMETAIILAPRKEWPTIVQELRLWK